jgi:hypothetical protein
VAGTNSHQGNRGVLASTAPNKRQAGAHIICIGERSSEFGSMKRIRSIASRRGNEFF